MRTFRIAAASLALVAAGLGLTGCGSEVVELAPSTYEVVAAQMAPKGDDDFPRAWTVIILENGSLRSLTVLPPESVGSGGYDANEVADVRFADGGDMTLKVSGNGHAVLTITANPDPHDLIAG